MKMDRTGNSTTAINKKTPVEKNEAKPVKPRRKPQNKADKKSSLKPDAIANLIAEEALPSNKPNIKTGHMTPEEVERHLESRRAQQSQLEFSFAPDKAPATVPTEMFSNDMDGNLIALLLTKQ